MRLKLYRFTMRGNDRVFDTSDYYEDEDEAVEAYDFEYWVLRRLDDTMIEVDE